MLILLDCILPSVLEKMLLHCIFTPITCQAASTWYRTNQYSVKITHRSAVFVRKSRFFNNFCVLLSYTRWFIIALWGHFLAKAGACEKADPCQQWHWIFHDGELKVSQNAAFLVKFSQIYVLYDQNISGMHWLDRNYIVCDARDPCYGYFSKFDMISSFDSNQQIWIFFAYFAM